MASRVLAVLGLAACLALPLAAAGAPVEGDARGEGGPVLDGEGALGASSGVLDLTAPARAGALRLAWSTAAGERTTQRGTLTAGTSYEGAPPDTARVDWPAGNLSAFRCADGCIVRLVPVLDGEVGLAGRVTGAPAVAAHARLAAADVPTPGGAVRVATPVEEAWLVAAAAPGAPGYAVPDGAPYARGVARLDLWNVTATRAWDGGAEDVRAGVTRTPQGPAPLGTPLQEEVRVERLTLELRGVLVDAPPGSGAVLAGPTLDARLDGAAAWPQAEGRVVVRGRETRLDGERLDLVGVLALTVAPAGPAPDAAARVASPPTGGAFAGEATSVRVDGRELVRAADDVPPAAARTAAGALGIAGLLWLLARTGAWAALYSRVTGPRVLTNPNRLAAYELIVSRPGVHVSEMSREMGVGRVVLQHHLRILETHRLVVARAVGRVRTYYPSGGSPDPETARVDAALKDATRARVLAEVLASAEGVTQKELVERTGLSQRLVSYHLARLEGTLLVRGDGGRPQRFSAGPRAPPSAHPARPAAGASSS